MNLICPEMEPYIAQIERSAYWKMPPSEQADVWIKIISIGAGISEQEAAVRIERNNVRPLEDQSEGYLLYPRFNSNASLLAQSSPFRDGPRGPRPSLASAANILRISNIPARQVALYGMKLKQHMGGLSSFLLELGITASNPEEAPQEVQFSDDDIKAGIYIPPKVDVSTIQAIAIAYGVGNFGNGGHLLLTTPVEDKAFFEVPVRKSFSEAFNFSSDQLIREVENESFLKPGGYTSLHLSYASKALRTYYLGYLGFPSTRDERREVGLSEKVTPLSQGLQDEFLRYFLASAATYDWDKGLLRVNDVSKPILEDIRKMIEQRVTRHSISLREKTMGGGYTLSLSTIPAAELFVQGYLDGNERIRKIAKQFWDTRMGFRAFGYIKRNYELPEEEL